MRDQNQIGAFPSDPHAGRIRPTSRTYREIGLAAIAIELQLLEEDLGEDMEEAIERGARYLAPVNFALAS